MTTRCSAGSIATTRRARLWYKCALVDRITGGLMTRLRMFGVASGVAVCLVVPFFAWVSVASSAPPPGAPWSGMWTRQVGEVSSGQPLVFTLSQTGSTITGTFPWQGCATKQGGTFAGTATGLTASMTFTSNDGSVGTISATLSPDLQTISGSYTVTMGSCVGTTGGFDATYLPPPLQALTVSLSGSGSGSVTGAGINCPGTCTASVAQSTIVTLTATPASGSTFAGWGGACSGTALCTVTMSSAQSVDASFSKSTKFAVVITRSKTSHHGASFTFHSIGGQAKGFQCALVRHTKKRSTRLSYSACTSPKAYKDLHHGSYTFHVRAMSEAGIDSLPSVRSVTIP